MALPGSVGGVRWDWLVQAILVLHFGYLVYVVLGGFVAWRWPRTIYVHVATALWGILIVLEWVDCPLTWAEGWAREKAGEAPLTEGFIDRYIDGVIYPQQYLNEVRAAVALVILISWIGAYRMARRRKARALAAAEAVKHEPGDSPGETVQPEQAQAVRPQNEGQDRRAVPVPWGDTQDKAG